MDDDLDLSFESDNDELTAAEVLAQMQEIWINEKFAPEILPQKMDIVDCMNLQIQTMETNISGLQKHDFIRRAHEMELVRIRYILTSYLRTRLIKIETYAQTILEQEAVREANGEELYLTENEKNFALSYKNSLDQYFNETLKFIPGHVPDDYKQQFVKPFMDRFVFLQSKKSIEGVMVQESPTDSQDHENDFVDLMENSKMIMPYRSIANLLKKGDVKLI